MNKIHEIYDIIKSIKDPEFPYSLEELNIVDEDCIVFKKTISNVTVVTIYLTPTTPHCSLMLTIGLSIRYKLLLELTDFKSIKIDLLIREGKHKLAEEIDKQLNDKERYLAAFENEYIVEQIKSLINTTNY